MDTWSCPVTVSMPPESSFFSRKIDFIRKAWTWFYRTLCDVLRTIGPWISWLFYSMPADSNNLLLFNLDVVEPLSFLIRLKKEGIKKINVRWIWYLVGTLKFTMMALQIVRVMCLWMWYLLLKDIKKRTKLDSKYVWNFRFPLPIGRRHLSLSCALYMTDLT